MEGDTLRPNLEREKKVGPMRRWTKNLDAFINLDLLVLRLLILSTQKPIVDRRRSRLHSSPSLSVGPDLTGLSSERCDDSDGEGEEGRREEDREQFVEVVVHLSFDERFLEKVLNNLGAFSRGLSQRGRKQEKEEE